jgi:uncharacterized protein
MADRTPDDLPFGRRRRSAASALVAILVAFLLGMLLNAPAMKKTAQELPFGGARSFRLALVDPLAAVSHRLFLDRPARLTAEALGKPDPGPAGAPFVVVVTPPPRPSGKPGPFPNARPLPAPKRGDPLRLYIGGDSMAGIPGMALINLAKDTGVIKSRLDYHISSGLARPDFFNWPAQLVSQVKALHPGAAVLMFGANDQQGVQAANGKVYAFESTGWKTEYRKRVRDVMDILFDGGVKRIYWIGQPIMPEAIFSRHMRVLNEIYRSEARKRPGVPYIDAYRLFSTGSGAYSDYLKDEKGRLQQVREGDGTHLTYVGGVRLARVVLAAIKADWLAKKKGGMVSGSPLPSPGGSPKASPAP